MTGLGGVKVAPSDYKVMAIRNAPLPSQTILGTDTLFIPHYADKARLLHQAICKAVTDCVVWCNELIECFCTLQSSLTRNSSYSVR